MSDGEGWLNEKNSIGFYYDKECTRPIGQKYSGKMNMKVKTSDKDDSEED